MCMSKNLSNKIPTRDPIQASPVNEISIEKGTRDAAKDTHNDLLQSKCHGFLRCTYTLENCHGVRHLKAKVEEVVHEHTDSQWIKESTIKVT